MVIVEREELKTSQESQSLVSVIMNCFNGEEYLSEAINSVLLQTYKNWELIFWDNQSSDRSAEIALSYDDPRIKYFYASKHTLLYEARNYAIERSKGEFLAFLDVDDWWESDKLAIQLAHFEDENVGLVCTNYNVFYEGAGWARPFWSGLKPSGFILKDLLNDYHVGLLTILFRRSTYDSLGGFDSRYHVIGDMDFSMRLAEQWKIQTVNQALAHYRKHATNESELKRNMYLEELKIWTVEAKVRLNQTNSLSLMNLEKLILYLEGQNAVIKDDYLITITKLYQLFPSVQFFKLFLKATLPSSLINFLNKIKHIFF